MEKYTIDKDVKVFCVTAKSFPDGALEAHQKLHARVPFTADRRYFGISRPNEKGIITYKAAAEEKNPKEGEELGFEPFTIKSGQYIGLTIKDYIHDIQRVGDAFQKIIARDDIDPQGYCVELYLNDSDVRCMVRLKD